jgi:RimJ/RimL family protein N-acetyltransferase
MFGVNMVIEHKSLVVKLRPFAKADMPILTEHFSSMTVHMFTNGLFAQTLENEEEWYEKNRKANDTCIWAIQPEGHEYPIGTTGLHGIDSLENTCTSGIIIWDQSLWGKGIASAAHLGRTLFAADYLNRFTIKSSVRTANVASKKALERVGYSVCGTEPAANKRAGVWLHNYNLKWVHPDMTSIFYPEGLPDFLIEGSEKAKVALELARKEVKFP